MNSSYRATDGARRGRIWIWLRRAYRALTLLVPVFAIALAAYAVNGTQSDLDRQVEGRGIAIDVLCGFARGVEDAGKKALRGQLAGQDGQGLPQAAITDYNQTISASVVHQAGVVAEDLIRADGSINCDALARAARAVPQPHSAP